MESSLFKTSMVKRASDKSCLLKNPTLIRAPSGHTGGALDDGRADFKTDLSGNTMALRTAENSEM